MVWGGVLFFLVIVEPVIFSLDFFSMAVLARLLRGLCVRLEGSVLAFIGRGWGLTYLFG